MKDDIFQRKAATLKIAKNHFLIDICVARRGVVYDSSERSGADGESISARYRPLEDVQKKGNEWEKIWR